MLLIIRIILIVIWFAFSAFCGLVVSLFRPFHPNNPQVIAKLLNLLGPRILGIKIIARNLAIMDTVRPCVFISNHQHNLDIFPGSWSLSKRTVSLGKRSLIYIPVFGIFYWLSGNILINRSNKKSALDTMDIVAKSIKEKNTSVWIMPEGTRSKGRGLLPFKKGPFITAIKAEVPIVSVAISNYVKKINLNRWHSGVIIVEVLPPISTKDFSMETVNDLKDHAFNLMKNKLDQLDAEVDAMKT